MKYCSECGFENVDEAIFCRNCGAMLKEVNQESFSNNINEKEFSQKIIVNKNKDSIISKMFYKTDRHSGEFRLAKTKTISIAVFVFMFLFAIFAPSHTQSFEIVFFAAIIFGLMFAVPTFAAGYILGWIMDGK